MRILPPVEQEIRRAIRDERAKDPLVPITKLQKRLQERFNREFKRSYLAKLSDKVARETLIEIDRTQIEQRMAFTRENYRMMREQLMRIVYWKPDDAAEHGIARPLARDQVEAAKSVVMLDLALLKAEIECGLYKNPTDVIAKDIRYDPLPSEVRAVVIAALQRGGLLPAAALERMVSLETETTVVTPGSTVYSCGSDHRGNPRRRERLWTSFAVIFCDWRARPFSPPPSREPTHHRSRCCISVLLG